MKRFYFHAAAIALLIAAGFIPAHAANSDEEQQLIQRLQSDDSLTHKDEACARLKLIGTDRAVPALAALLTDESLSHSARFALEAMTGPAAGRALLAALDKTSGTIQVGIINSLGLRQESAAVPALAKLLGTPNAEVAAAAAVALGRIGNPAALRALRPALHSTAATVHRAVADGLLRCAQRLIDTGHPSSAIPIYRQLYDQEKEDLLRVAAYRGWLRAAGKNSLKLSLAAIQDAAGPRQTAALQWVHEINASDASQKLAALLPKLEPTVQIALVGGLSQRGDAAALPPIVNLVRSSVPEVRAAALAAVGALGGPDQIPLLAQVAASGQPAEQKIARQALLQMHGGPVTDSLLNRLTGATPQEQAELTRALGDRGDRAAIPKLLELAQNGATSVRQSALHALAQLVDQPQLAALVDVAVKAADETTRAAAAEALIGAFQHIASQRGQADPAPLLSALQNASPEARIGLLPVCSSLNAAPVREALRTAVRDANPKVQAAAVRALCESNDPELLPDLTRIIQESKEETFRSLAIGSCVRLLTQEDPARFSNLQRVLTFQAILATGLRPDQKRQVLAGLAEVAMPESLSMASTLLSETEVQIEAARAIIKIAPGLPPAQFRTAEAALKQAAAAVTDATTRQAVDAALKQILENSEYITDWQMAGPYTQAGKDFAALIDVPFPPEKADAAGVNWLLMPTGTDPKRPWLMDLLKAIGGNDRVAYVRTWVHAEQDQPARLEIGADDGVKVWWNQQMVHALNVPRGLGRGSDKVAVQLKQGWNSLLIKVTQLNQGWEFCVRVAKPDGATLDGLKFNANPPAQ